jgi:hypothetical protein
MQHINIRCKKSCHPNGFFSSFEAFPDAWSGLVCSLDAMDPTLPSATKAGSVARSDLFSDPCDRCWDPLVKNDGLMGFKWNHSGL